jgi:hypothetical protein
VLNSDESIATFREGRIIAEIDMLSMPKSKGAWLIACIIGGIGIFVAIFILIHTIDSNSDYILSEPYQNVYNFMIGGMVVGIAFMFFLLLFSLYQYKNFQAG